MLEVENINIGDYEHNGLLYRMFPALDQTCTQCELVDDTCPSDEDGALLCTSKGFDKIWKEIKVVKKTDMSDKPITDYSNKAEGIIGTTTVIGRKFDQEKPRYDLLPANALEEVVKVLTYGASKYDDENWRKVPEGRRRYFAAAQRHLWQHKRGELIDADSKCYHLACAITSLMFMLEKELTNEPDIKE